MRKFGLKDRLVFLYKIEKYSAEQGISSYEYLKLLKKKGNYSKDPNYNAFIETIIDKLLKHKKEVVEVYLEDYYRTVNKLIN
jgi:hypothetical protein